jgi:hypothetical protein
MCAPLKACCLMLLPRSHAAGTIVLALALSSRTTFVSQAGPRTTSTRSLTAAQSMTFGAAIETAFGQHTGLHVPWRGWRVFAGTVDVRTVAAIMEILAGVDAVIHTIISSQTSIQLRGESDSSHR